MTFSVHHFSLLNYLLDLFVSSPFVRYLKVFQNLDLSSNFYFSYSYDLTLSLQCQMRTNPGTFPPPCRKFIWNDHLLDGFEGAVHPKWILHIIHGFVGQYSIL